MTNNQRLTEGQGSYFEGAWNTLDFQEKSLFDRVVAACGPDTCAPAIKEELPEFEKERNAYGSCIVAASVFLSSLDAADREQWYPVILEDMSFDKDHTLRYHVSLFNRKTGKLMDFTPAARFGGVAALPINEQEMLLETIFLSDSTLKRRIGNALHRYNSTYQVNDVLDIFLTRFRESLKQKIGLNVLKVFAPQ